MKARSETRRTKLRTKLSKQRKKNPVEIVGADLAPVGWEHRIVSFGSGLCGQLGTSALLDTKHKHCSVHPCWVSLEAAGGDYEAREPCTVVCSATATYSVMENGTLFAWGTGSLGCSPDASAVVEMVTTKTRIPRHVAIDIKVKLIASAPTNHCLLLSFKGAVYAWGNGNRGKLGLGDVQNRVVPTVIPSLNEAIQWIGCGSEYSAAISSHGGNLYTWGDGSIGQLGRATDMNTVPEKVVASGLGNMEIMQCATGHEHVLVVVKNKDTTTNVYSWGNSTFGRLGNLEEHERQNNTTSNKEQKSNNHSNNHSNNQGQYVPSEINIGKGLVSILSVAAGQKHSMALTSNGLVFAWGSNEMGQLGLGKKLSKKKMVATPTLVALPLCVQLQCGNVHSAAVTDTGDVYVWGMNDVGQLGLGEVSAIKRIPIQIPSLEQYYCKQIALGAQHTGIVFGRRPSDVNVDTTRNESKELGKTRRKEWKEAVEERIRLLKEKETNKRKYILEQEKKKINEQRQKKLNDAKQAKEREEALKIKLEQAKKDKLERKRKEALERAEREQKEMLLEQKRKETEEKNRILTERIKKEKEKKAMQQEQERIEQEKIRLLQETKNKQLRDLERQEHERQRKIRDEERQEQKLHDEEKLRKKLLYDAKIKEEERKKLEKEYKLQQQQEMKQEALRKRMAEKEQQRLAKALAKSIRDAKREAERKEREEKEQAQQKLIQEKRDKIAMERKLEQEKMRKQQLRLRLETKKNELARKKAREAELHRKEKERLAWLEKEQNKRKEALALATLRRKKKEKNEKYLQAQLELEARRKLEEIRREQEEAEQTELARRKENARIRMIEKAKQKRMDQMALAKRKNEIEKLAQEQEQARKKMEEERIQRARKHRKKKEKNHQEQFILACQDIVDAEQKLTDAKQRRRKEAQAWMEKKDIAMKKLTDFERKPMTELISGLSLTPRSRKPRIDRGVLKTSGVERPKSSSSISHKSPPMKAMLESKRKGGGK